MSSHCKAISTFSVNELMIANLDFIECQLDEQLKREQHLQALAQDIKEKELMIDELKARLATCKCSHANNVNVSSVARWPPFVNGPTTEWTQQVTGITNGLNDSPNECVHTTMPDNGVVNGAMNAVPAPLPQPQEWTTAVQQNGFNGHYTNLDGENIIFVNNNYSHSNNNHDNDDNVKQEQAGIVTNSHKPDLYHACTVLVDSRLDENQDYCLGYSNWSHIDNINISTDLIGLDETLMTFNDKSDNLFV